MKKGQRIKLKVIEGYEAYEGVKGTVLHHDKSQNLVVLSMDRNIDGEYTFITSPKEICRLP
ncbi:hypothetical protein [Salinivibrio phage CW02]|uniref:Uncharacterized protein n=1 Tax=Salinivibrio phage CW02 TaxID=1161935 RepID=H9D1D9_9CAUD|nr:hypothetical protein F490_gp56 [Salinivibrio phage CW02]AFE86181.1 hypothetical protein [Salinivibrio phage CW02]